MQVHHCIVLAFVSCHVISSLPASSYISTWRQCSTQQLLYSATITSSCLYVFNYWTYNHVTYGSAWQNILDGSNNIVLETSKSVGCFGYWECEDTIRIRCVFIAVECILTAKLLVMFVLCTVNWSRILTHPLVQCIKCLAGYEICGLVISIQLKPNRYTVC